MNILVWSGSLLALITYFPLWYQIKVGKTEQNRLTWGLWAALDIIATLTIVIQKGNFLLPVAYVIGSIVTVYFISRTGKKATWTWFETMVTVLVIICMIIWCLVNSRAATIASSSALLIAGIPQLVDAWKRPQEMPFLVYASYVIANGLSTAGGKNWSIEERFYPATATILCFLFIVVIFVRKYWLKQRDSWPITNT